MAGSYSGQDDIACVNVAYVNVTYVNVTYVNVTGRNYNITANRSLSSFCSG